MVGGQRAPERAAQGVGVNEGGVDRGHRRGAGGGAGAVAVFVRAKFNQARVRLAQGNQVQARVVGAQSLHARLGQRGKRRLVHAQSRATG